MTTRREFFKYSMILGGVVLFGSSVTYYFSQNNLSGTYYNISFRPYGEDVKKNHLVLTNFSTGLVKEFPVSIDPHSVIISPTERHQCLMIEKWDRSLCLIDTNSGKIIAEYVHPVSSKRQFIGHALFSADGRIIYTSEAVFSEDGPEKYGTGKIGLRDSSTLELIKEFPSYGIDPHEMVWLNDHKTLVVCNQGHLKDGRKTIDRNIAYIDSLSGELLKLEEVPLELSPAHLRKFGEDNLAIVTRSLYSNNLYEQDQRLLIKLKDKPIQLMPLPDDLKYKLSKELLSLAVCESRGVIATTYPYGKKVIFWDYVNMKHLKTVECGTVTGVVVSNDDKHFLVNDLENGLLIFSSDTLKSLKLNKYAGLQERKFQMPHSYLTNH